MALNVPSFPSPYSSTPLADAYAWLSFLALDILAGEGRAVFNINPSAADWDKPPVAQVSVSLGQTITPASGEAEAVAFPTLAELMQDQEFANAYNVVGAKLYALAATRLPVFSGSTSV